MSTPTTAAGHPAPRADCLAASDGGITFDVSGPADLGTVLVLKRRGGKGPADELRLPLTRPGGGAAPRAVLPATAELAEGRWDACTETGEAVQPGIRDLRVLVDRAPGSGPVAVRVPYPTADGRLAVRCWRRAPHAEAGELAFAPEQGAMTVAGLLYGAELGEGPVALARQRSGERVHEVPVTGEGREFGFTLPYEPLVEHPEGAEDAGTGKERLWELWLRPAAGAAPVRISRLLDDVWDKKSIFVYPKQHVAGHTVAPCYTGDNDLCVRVTPEG
ncbi:hypothetical protein ACH46N_27740 [Streptomyces pristinaespiralis]|uniref:Transferase n=1 Tax=Streptomyces pristinaespiralis TaxID=38300 RepID=A0A0M3QK38_STRPR|nr:hypothetical protein [Streptomyces pristinaespiralis]ALC24083.1 transferase [Streptomyces pristinaespiralis]QMU13525.1 hypothetical protein H3L99_07880 [Streptomyces pristinaespiralis]